MKVECKNCGKESTNGTNFCTKKCRIGWIREHNIRGAKKKYAKHHLDQMCKIFGLTHSCLDKSSTGG